MAEQSLTPENLESYSTEAISNFSKAIEDFADLITEIKSEDANIAVFNSIYLMIDGRKRRLADIANIEAPNDPLNLEVMVYSRDNMDLVIDTIKDAGFPAKKQSDVSQYINVRVPKPSRMQLEEIADDLIRRTNGMTSRLMKLKTNTGLRIRAAVQNEFIDTRIATLSTKKIDAAYEKFNKEARILGLLRRKQILGKFYKPSEKDDEILIKDVNLMIRLSGKIKYDPTADNQDDDNLNNVVDKNTQALSQEAR